MSKYPPGLIEDTARNDYIFKWEKDWSSDDLSYLLDISIKSYLSQAKKDKNLNICKNIAINISTKDHNSVEILCKEDDRILYIKTTDDAKNILRLYVKLKK